MCGDHEFECNDQQNTAKEMEVENEETNEWKKKFEDLKIENEQLLKRLDIAEKKKKYRTKRKSKSVGDIKKDKILKSQLLLNGSTKTKKLELIEKAKTKCQTQWAPCFLWYKM